METEIIIFFGTVVFCFLVCNCFCKNQNNQIHSERNLIGIRIDVENNQNILVEENQNLSNEENQILEDALNISRETYKNEFNENLNKLEIILLKDHPSFTDEELECPISFDSLNLNEEIYLLPCKHIFKKIYLEEMLRLKNECPICREKIFL